MLRATKVRRPNCLSPATQIRLNADVYRYSTSDDDSGCVLDEYSWVPSGLKPDDVHTYFAALPNEKVPFVNSIGETWRLSQLKYQLPAQDSDPSISLTESERAELQNFENARKKECLGRGHIQRLPYDNSRRYCHQCKQPINTDDLVVGAQRFGERAVWHPRCFVCVECTELLVELIYYKHEDNVFCGRHHAEQIKPRCKQCDELIFSEECTEAEGDVWHMKHFSCTLCNAQLGGMKYVMRSEKPFCVPCYNKSIAIACNTCGYEISSEKPHITQGSTHWHADQRCFCCVQCNKNLLGKNYSLIGSSLYCGTEGCVEIRSSKRLSRRNDTIIDQQTPINGRVRFDFRPPKPPIQSPPLPPIQLNQTPPENIYETLSEFPLPPTTKRRSKHRKFDRHHHSEDDFDSGSMTSATNSADECCSAIVESQQMIKMRMKQKKEARYRRHKQRRSLSMDGCSSKICTLHSPAEDLSFDQLSLKYKNNKTPKRSNYHQNYYSGMPPSVKSPCSYASTSSSESDSDDDIYLNLSSTLTPPQYIARQQQRKVYSASKQQLRTPTSIRSYNDPKRRHKSMISTTPRMAKKKSNANCFIS